MKYLLDTNICIYAIKRRPASVFDKLKTLEIGDAGVSAITAAELYYGVFKSSFPDKNRLALVNFLAPFDILTFNDEAGAVYGRIRVNLEKRGSPIGAYDMLIAAQALAGDLTLVTNDEREFGRIPDLRVENWAVI